MTNIVVQKTVNEVTWRVDRTAFGRAMKAVKSLRSEWEKTGKVFSSNRTDPAASLKRSAMQARLVSKRLQQTERAEQAKSTAHSIALAKKEAKAKEAIDKIQRARRKQAVSSLTAGRSPESQSNYNSLKAQLREQEKAAGRFGGVAGASPEVVAARKAALQAELARKAQGSGPGGNLGGPGHDPELLARQNRAMAQSVQKTQQKATKEQTRAREKARKEQEAEDRRYSKYLAGKESTVANASVRLRAKYGDDYASKMKGFSGLKERFLDSNTMRSSNFRAELAAMEAGIRKANASTLSFGDGIKDLRSTLISATAAFGAFNAAAGVLKTGQFFQGMEATMLMVSDDSKEAGERLGFVRDQAYRLGLDLKIAAQGYTQMSIASNGVLSKSQNDSLFKAFSEYSTALQVDPVKYQRGITAIQQMMGKGQIMAEELKQQLAEGIPGSLQVFLKASQEAFGDSSIDLTKMLKMMEDGKLKADKVLPFVAKYYAEAANKGGALEKALQGNRVAMQRLTLTWMDFQNKIFQSGFGEQMTNTFNQIADLIDSNGPLAAAVGEMAAGFMQAFSDIIGMVSDTFVLISAILQHYIPILRSDGEEISSAWKWVGWGTGALFFAASLVRVFKILSMIAGLSASLKFLKDIFGKTPGAPDVGTGEGGTGGPGKGGSRMGRMLKGAGKMGGILSLFALGSDLNDRFNPFSDFNDERSKVFGTIHDQLVSGKGNSSDSWLTNLFGSGPDALGYLNTQIPGGAASKGGSLVIPTEPVTGEIIIKLDAGDLKDMVSQQIDASNMSNINLILGVPY